MHPCPKVHPSSFSATKSRRSPVNASKRAEGSAKVDKARLTGQVVREFSSWGKHLLIELEDVSVRIHLLLFGSYRINERKDSTPRLSLGFADGELNFYACSVQLIEGPLDATYDWSMDVMSAAWSPRGTLKRLRERPRLLACDALLDQTLFAGSGNIIKNEVLYRIRVHPLSLIGELPPASYASWCARRAPTASSFSSGSGPACSRPTGWRTARTPARAAGFR